MISSGIPAKLLSTAGGAASATVAATFCRLVALPGTEATGVVGTSLVHSGKQTSSFHGNCKSMKQIFSSVEKDKGRPRANLIRSDNFPCNVFSGIHFFLCALCTLRKREKSKTWLFP